MRSSMLSRVVLAAVVAAATAPVAMAQNLIDPRQRYERNVDPIRISLDQAVSMAESRYRAKAVRAETVRSGDRVVYQIRLLSAGKVWTVRVDAQSGQMN